MEKAHRMVQLEDGQITEDVYKSESPVSET
jgi:hypothetical protein